MAAICPKYLEHGFCIHGSSCTLQHIDKPPTPTALQMNGNMLKTSFGNLTLDDISSTPSFIPASHHVIRSEPVQAPLQAPLMPPPTHMEYYLPSTRMDMPTRAFIPTPPHLEKPSADNSTGSELCDMLMYQQSITSLYIESKLPDVEKYYALHPLEPEHPTVEPQGNMYTFSYPSVCYRAYSSVDGCVYTLHRYKNCQINTLETKKILDRWRAISHPNIVTVHEAFPTKQFGDNSFVVVYDFCAGARNFKQLHFQKEQGFLDESLLWNYIIQLTSAIRTVHANKLSCRMINPSKIIVTARNRLRLNCLGVMDLLMGSVLDDPSKPFVVQHQQQEDIVELGKLIVCISCNSISAIHQSNLSKSSDVISSTYTADVRTLLQHLLNKSPQPRKINDLMPMIGARFYTHIERLRVENDTTQNELMKELENGRLFRVLCKINSVLDRPEHMLDPGWCETGERYILKLFRNYMFHKVDELGAPWIDLPHLLMCLNKLDAGSLEQLMLTSPHEQSVIICTYKDIKNNFDKCFNEIFLMQGNL
ncbi:PAN2-PAN3 deadenylation complex subunit pan3-like [Bolinopsis microptera]|uniref:PAN2-PAN3 deadenylation complex subunit pan3-like n=1 Tax=Bolinopsis microptera TaxID=2820187 RepID=UPI00307A72EA